MGSPESETDRDPDESPRITQNIANGFWSFFTRSNPRPLLQN